MARDAIAFDAIEALEQGHVFESYKINGMLFANWLQYYLYLQ